jgi:hypothetical protein
MNRNRLRNCFIGIFCFCLLTMGAAWGQENKKDEKAEKKIALKDLPKAVQQTVQEQSKGAQIVGIGKEVENGKTSYEVEMKINGHAKDIEIDADGILVEVEEEVALTSLSPAVQLEINKSAGKGKILKLESLTKDSQLKGYEAMVETAGKKAEIAMTPDGKLLSKAK